MLHCYIVDTLPEITNFLQKCLPPPPPPSHPPHSLHYPSPWVIGELILEELRLNWDFGWELALLSGGGFFQVGLENSLYKK